MKPSPGSNDFEQLPCLAVRALYCEAKFGSSCEATCFDKLPDLTCALECAQQCKLYKAQCLASTECPFSPDISDQFDRTSIISELAGLQSQEVNTYVGVAAVQNQTVQSGLHYYAMENEDNGFVQRGIAGRNGVAHPTGLLLAANSNYRHHILQAATFLVGYSDFTTLASGTTLKLPATVLGVPTSPDQDSDGLHDYGEFIIGTTIDNPDTDGDGIKDGAEVQQGTDPLDGLPAATGIIATADTPGTAVDVCAINDLAAVADSNRGVTIFSVVNGTSNQPGRDCPGGDAG
jgi:hypothetical protein